MFHPVLLSALVEYEKDFRGVGPSPADEFLLRWLKRQQGVTHPVNMFWQRLCGEV
jgi:hypothetical protein